MRHDKAGRRRFAGGCGGVEEAGTGALVMWGMASRPAGVFRRFWRLPGDARRSLWEIVAHWQSRAPSGWGHHATMLSPGLMETLFDPQGSTGDSGVRRHETWASPETTFVAHFLGKIAQAHTLASKRLQDFKQSESHVSVRCKRLLLMHSASRIGSQVRHLSTHRMSRIFAAEFELSHVCETSSATRAGRDSRLAWPGLRACAGC